MFLKKLLSKFKRNRKRIQMEDILKRIYHLHSNHLPVNNEMLSKDLEINTRQTNSLISELLDSGFLTLEKNKLALTESGEKLAIQIIRAHRLWERYLVDEAGISLEEIHQKAESREHQLTPEDTDLLEAQLGYPQDDPHGDPIPSTEYQIKTIKTSSLNQWPLNRPGRIVHIEDEPEEIFKKILSLNLSPDNNLKILKKGEQGYLIESNHQKNWISEELSGNIFLVRISESEYEIPAKTLSSLKPGHKAVIAYLKCRGLTRRRLMDLGMVPGTIIEAVMPSIFREPLAYRIRGTMIALRKEQAEQIFIESDRNKGLTYAES